MQEHIKGIIRAQPKETVLEHKENMDHNYLAQLFQVKIASIKEELTHNFPPSNNEYYIYYRPNLKKNTLKIFVNLLKNTSLNHREQDINFLIHINEEFPDRAPMVFCLTDVSKNITKFNKKYIQKLLNFPKKS